MKILGPRLPRVEIYPYYVAITASRWFVFCCCVRLSVSSVSIRWSSIIHSCISPSSMRCVAMYKRVNGLLVECLEVQCLFFYDMGLSCWHENHQKIVANSFSWYNTSDVFRFFLGAAKFWMHWALARFFWMTRARPKLSVLIKKNKKDKVKSNREQHH